ncbi:DUF1242-domain-containing protein [Rhizoclosmatium globosum]|uniref:Protein kish n=1 Tax=Rhizoclosmatium globosum TaxID=329046 RepID=A0A1Y2AJY3_9FUNG|nr:hypothetical protein HDU99_005849 [Rhizoclosmatium hyalinum]KAJ3289341.1 hypothetical protein HDU79_004129 [Rhizoclosmatium sp. JEL0117]ORY22537.1 DUF1242-domain-containing protein [Rhizoclosmatium globosum]|eukprot:ORY22537.1 DUF1242-domain-containing protein [Rhizoclosmatium globosum]
MTAIFKFDGLLLILLLLICTSTFIRAQAPSLIDRNKHGLLGSFWKMARIGERLSPYVALACIAMAIKTLVH